MESLERLLLVMGERLQLGTERLQGEDDDRYWQQVHRERSMAERLEHAFDAAGFSGELRGLASRQG
jgi:hypothetical protein